MTHRSSLSTARFGGSHADGCHRRRHPHPARTAQRQVEGRSPRRPRGARAAGGRRAQRHRPRAHRRRDHGLRHAGRRAGHQHRPQRRARGRVPGDHGRHHDRPPVRFVAAGRALRRAGRDGRRVRRRDRGGRREHDACADGRVGRRRQVRLPVRSDDDGSLPQPRPAGDLGGVDRREVGHHARGQRRVLGPVAPPRGAGARRGPLRPGDPPGDRARRVRRRDRQPGRRHPARLVDGDARQAEAGVQARRCGHRRELVADHRRRGRGADHERGEGERSSASSPAPGSTRSPSPASTRC